MFLLVLKDFNFRPKYYSKLLSIYKSDDYETIFTFQNREITVF